MRSAAVILYRMRLKISAVLSMLEMIRIAASVTRAELLEKGKPERHAPFKNLLFALTVRCAGLLESALFLAQAIGANGMITLNELSDMEDIISKKRKDVAAAQRLLEKGMLAAGLSRLAESAIGLKGLAEKLDGKIEEVL